MRKNVMSVVFAFTVVLLLTACVKETTIQTNQLTTGITTTTTTTHQTTAPVVTTDTGGIQVTMQEYVEAMQPGWNLGNTLEAYPAETSWGNPTITKQLIDNIAAAGFKSIRIPIRWDQRIGTAPNYTIRADFLARVKQVVDWSQDGGLYVMINMHHEEWTRNMESNRPSVQARFDAAWTQIANYFKDYDHTLMFESINEPRFSDDWNKDTPLYFEMLDDLNTHFHSIVRNLGGNNETRPLVLSTLTGSTSQARLNELNKTISKLNDANIIVTVHYYGLWQFSVNIAGVTSFSAEVKKDIDDSFTRVYNTFVSKGIPVILGEYGLLGFDSSLGTIQQGEKLKYFEYLTYYAKQKGITYMLWDNGQHYNRRTYSWGDVDLYNVIISSVDGRSTYTERDFIYLKKDETIVDKSLTMTLNGNTLVNVKNGNTILVNGTDYEVSGTRLTFKASLLQSLVTNNYGTNATLTCEFSTGANWNIRVIYYDTPTFSNQNGTTSSYTIPVNFNGDQLATMSATYKSGGNAGPQSWTPYKEFDKDFKPNYSNNTIQITSKFFNEVRDGEVVLKFHFWSGAIIEYSITKSGSSITGVSLI